MMSRRCRSLALAFLLAACGGTSPLTQIVVVVDSDLRVDELDTVSIEVAGGNAPAQTTSASLAMQALPRSLGLVHSTGPLGPVRVSVRGLLGGDTVVERSAVVWFEQDKTVLLRMPLARACAGDRAPTCDSSTTCDSGSCVAAEMRPLPVWDGKVTPFVGVDAAVGGRGAGGSIANAGRTGNAGRAGNAGTGGVGAGGAGTGGAGTGGVGTAGAGRGGASGGSAGNTAAGSGGDVPDAGMPDGSTNRPPVCTISKPTAGTSFVQADTVTFTGTCTDPETGALTSGLSWSSNRDGSIGAGASRTSTSLSLGTHVITFCATDPADSSTSGCANVSITVTTLSATITSLLQGSTSGASFVAGTAIVAQGSGTGADPVTLSWSDSLIGAVAGTSSATLAAPLVGRHRLTLTVTDGRMRTATDTRTFVVLPSGQSKLLAPYTVVNQTLFAEGTGRVTALAADAMKYYVAADPGDLYGFPASAAPTSGPAPVGLIAYDSMNAVTLHAASGNAYIATDSALEVCGYVVSTGIDSNACTVYQGSNLPSTNITDVLRLGTYGTSTDQLLLGTDKGLFVPASAAAPNGTGSTTLSGASVTSLAASATSLWVLAVDSLHWVALTSGTPLASSPSWQTVPVGGGSLSLTDVALGASDAAWVTGAAGLGRYSSSSGWKLYRAAGSGNGAPSLASDDARSVAISSPMIGGSARDVIWVGTAAGVSRLDTQLDSITNFTTDDGLPSNSVRAVLVLPNGDKLFGTDAGIALYKGL
jgi:hypothetical protein